MVRRLRSFAKVILESTHRLLHPLWRARARSRLRAASPVRSVLFICLGNVCRSPYAEASFAKMSPVTAVDSAGFIGPDRNPPEDAQLIARERGVDVSAHVSKLVTPELVRRHDLVVVMEPRQAGRIRRLTGGAGAVIVLGDLDPERPARRTIRDPWGQPPEVFRSSFARIDRCLTAILGVPTRPDAPAQAPGEPTL